MQRLALLVLLVWPVFGQTAPFVFRGGVVSAASFTSNLLPGGGLARGSIFTIFGRSLGPATPVQVSKFPLDTRLSGVSINIRDGSKVTPAIPLFVYEGQINAILPSSSATGTLALQVVYNGQNSNWVPIRVVDHAPGVFTATGAGRGWGIFQNFISAAEQPLNSGTNAVRPGAVGTLWLTGTGAIKGSDSDTPPVGDLPYNVEVFIGGKTVTRRLYAGRAPGISGLDQFVFYVPDDAPTGCFVPVYVRVNGEVSNSTTMAIMPEGGRCADQHNPIGAALIQGGKIVHSILYRGTTSAKEFLGIDVDVTADKAAVRAMQEPGGQFAFDPFLAAPPPGTCTSYTMRGNIMTSGLQMSSGGKALDLGRLSAIAGSNSIELTTLAPGIFSTILGGGYPALLSLFFSTGSFSLASSSGADGRAFTVPVASGVTLDGFNADQLRTIDRKAGLTINWRGQSGVAAFIVGSAYDKPTNSSGLCLCVSSTGSSSLTVPDYVLAKLPATRGVSDQGEARLFLSAMPALRETVTADQIRVFSARQDLTVRSIQTIR